MTAPDIGDRGRPGRHRELRRSVAAVALVVLASSCSAPAGSSEAGRASPTSSTTAGPHASVKDARAAYVVPASCGTLRPDPTATHPGLAVATCWADALDAHGSVRAWTNGPPAMEAEVVLERAPRLRTEASDGRVVVLVDGVAHGLFDGTWLRGVLNSEVEDEALVAATGEFAAVTFAPEGLAQGIVECPAWKVAPGRSTVTLHDGSQPSRLVRLDCTLPFEVLGATATVATLWVREDWTPVHHASTLSVGGASIESVRDFTDHGSRFDIPTPSP